MLFSLPCLNHRIRNKFLCSSVYNTHKQGSLLLEIISSWLSQDLVLKSLRIVTPEEVKNKLLLSEFFSQKLLSLRKSRNILAHSHRKCKSLHHQILWIYFVFLKCTLQYIDYLNRLLIYMGAENTIIFYQMYQTLKRSPHLHLRRKSIKQHRG